jgi:plastocyanin
VRSLVLALLLVSTAARADDNKGVISGTVIFEGEAPDRPKLVRDSDPYCAKTERYSEDVVVIKGKVRDVLVRIKNGTMGSSNKAPSDPVVIDQRDCMYLPRVVGVMVGQKIVVRNGDNTYHNVHGTVGGKMVFNKPHAPNGEDLKLDGPAKADDVLELNCDIHPWMQAWAVVMDHPYFAVTGDDGAFQIRGLAPGTYTLEAWHPKLGLKTMTVKVGTGNKAQVTARLSYKP